MPLAALADRYQCCVCTLLGLALLQQTRAQRFTVCSAMAEQRRSAQRANTAGSGLSLRS